MAVSLRTGAYTLELSLCIPLNPEPIVPIIYLVFTLSNTPQKCSDPSYSVPKPISSELRMLNFFLLS